MTGRHRAHGRHRATPTPINLYPAGIAALALAGTWLTLITGPTTAGTATYNAGPPTPPPTPPPAAPPPAPTVPIYGTTGLTEHAATLAHYIATHYPGVLSIGGVRNDPLPDHPSGRAIDVMIGTDTRLGTLIDNDVLAHADQFNVRYTIWQEIYRRPTGYHAWMRDRGNPTANHFDHVHITVN